MLVAAMPRCVIPIMLIQAESIRRKRRELRLRVVFSPLFYHGAGFGIAGGAIGVGDIICREVGFAWLFPALRAPDFLATTTLHCHFFRLLPAYWACKRFLRCLSSFSQVALGPSEKNIGKAEHKL
jgi:hypothetical protein